MFHSGSSFYNFNYGAQECAGLPQNLRAFAAFSSHVQAIVTAYLTPSVTFRTRWGFSSPEVNTSRFPDLGWMMLEAARDDDDARSSSSSSSSALRNWNSPPL
mmetsp:Transcript_17283/g.24185  ORF Transcript_17283/g.24185 Transcript_17283/m.24185 type:complete len:102 (-) Transcript_17283:514-819(-)